MLCIHYAVLQRVLSFQRVLCFPEKGINQKSLTVSCKAFFKIWHRPTLPRVTAVPSALVGLTSLFGMGRGGHHRYRHLNVLISLRYCIFSI